MSDNTSATPDPAYVPQRGDRVRWSTWGSSFWLDVKHVEDGFVYGVDEGGNPCAWASIPDDGGHWVKVTLPSKRYIVELRPPKKGERYLWCGSVNVASFDDYDDAHFVIVGEA